MQKKYKCGGIAPAGEAAMDKTGFNKAVKEFSQTQLPFHSDAAKPGGGGGAWPSTHSGCSIFRTIFINFFSDMVSQSSFF